MQKPSDDSAAMRQAQWLQGAYSDLLAQSGDRDSVQLALHLVDLVVYDDGPRADDARRRKADLLAQRSKAEPSFVARNVLRSAATLERDAIS